MGDRVSCRPARSDAALATTARLAFAAVLLPWFLISAASKLGGTQYSVGPDVPGTFLSLGAYHRLAPWTLDAATGMPVAGPVLDLGLQAMVLAELLLPVLVFAGLFTRVSAAGVIAIIVVTGVIDVYAHAAPPEAVGALFDASPFGAILDTGVLWVMLLAIPLAHGAGPVSIDAFWAWTAQRRRRHDSRPRQ